MGYESLYFPEDLQNVETPWGNAKKYEMRDGG
jgi:hypothetical protein